MVNCIQSSNPRIWAHFSLINSTIFLMFKVKKDPCFREVSGLGRPQPKFKENVKVFQVVGTKKRQTPLRSYQDTCNISYHHQQVLKMSPLFTPKQWHAFSWPLTFPFSPGVMFQHGTLQGIPLTSCDY